MNKCARCKSILVSHETAHAVNGELYCSKSCAIEALTDELILNAKEMASEKYNDEAEIVSTEEVLAEDLHTVQLTVRCIKYIKLPKTMKQADALNEAVRLYTDGIVVAEPDDCDHVDFKCELVEDNNSPQITGHTLFDLEEDE